MVRPERLVIILMLLMLAIVVFFNPVMAAENETNESRIGEYVNGNFSEGYVVDESSTSEAVFTIDSFELDDSEFGYDGKTLETWKSGSLHGGVYYTDTSSYTGILKAGEGYEYTLNVELPETADVKYSRLYVYSTWSHDTATKDAVMPWTTVSVDGSRLIRTDAYADKKEEGTYNYLIETDCYDTSGRVQEPGKYVISVENTGSTNGVFALYGVSVVIIYEDPDLPLVSCWITEGCDALLASEDYGTAPEDCMTVAEFEGETDIRDIKDATLILVSTAASGMESNEQIITFNDWEAFDLLTAGSSAISSYRQDVKPFLENTGNRGTIGSGITGSGGGYMENRNLILVIEYDKETSPAFYGNNITAVPESSGDEKTGDGSPAKNGEAGNTVIKPEGYEEARHIDYGNGLLQLFIKKGTILKDKTGSSVDNIKIKKEKFDEISYLKFYIGPEDAVADMSVFFAVKVENSCFFGNCSLVRYTGDDSYELVPCDYDNVTGILSSRINKLGTYGIVPDDSGDGKEIWSDLYLPGAMMDQVASSDFSIFGSLSEDGINKSIEDSAILSEPPGESSHEFLDNESSEIVSNDLTCENFNLSVLSNPGGALVYLDGEYTGKITPYMFDRVPGGNHTILFEIKGFQPSEEEISLSDDMSVSVEMDSGTGTLLEKRKYEGVIENIEDSNVGGVYVTSSIKATVYIDGTNTGMETPSVFSGFKEGLHTVKLKGREGIFPVSRKKVWVRPNQIVSVDFNQKPDISSTADIESDYYKGSYFTVNGKFPEYKMPKTVPADKGYSFITIYNDITADAGSIDNNENQSANSSGFENQPSIRYLSHTIHVTNENELNEIEPRDYTFGKVLVESDPSGAEIYVDGYDTGYCTPYAVDGLSDGRHVISVLKSGYIEKEKEILFVPDIVEYDEKIKFILESYPYGSLEVTSNPPGAKVYIYRKDTGKTTPYTFRYMDLGSIEIRIVGENVTKTIKDVMIKPYELTECNVDLTKQ